MKLTTLVLFATSKFCLIKCENKYPNIEDLFPETSKSEIEPMNLDIDIERIDIDKFNQKLDGLQTQLIGNETRRQVFDYYSRSQYKRASRYILKVKALDLSLQTIYMARHKVRQLETEKHYNRHHVGYRVAFLYRKLRYLRRKMMDLFMRLIKKSHGNENWHRNALTSMKIHTRVIKLYEEFQYLYWVLINIDGKHLAKLRTTTVGKTTTAPIVTRTSRTKSTTVRSTVYYGL